MMMSWVYENFSAVWLCALFGLAVSLFYRVGNVFSSTVSKSLTASDWALLGFWVSSGVGFLIATDLIFLFIFLVAFNICMYTIMLSTKTKAAAEATSKYLLFSSLSICSLLFGVFAYYCEYGTLNMWSISVILNESGWFSGSVTFWELIGGAFVVFAICVKLGAFPGFLWSADVYDGVSTTVLGLVLLSKIFIFALLVKLHNLFGFQHIFVWGPLLSILGCGSLVAGTFGAIMQQRLKRFLAYSSINQLGFGLIALSTETGSAFSSFSYVVVYVLSSLILVAIFSSVRTLADNRSFIYVSDLSTLMTKDSTLGWVVIFVILSLAGIPPFLGFFTKYSVLVTCASSTFAWGFLSFLVAACLLPIASFNYLRVIKNMLFRGYFSVTYASRFYISMPFAKRVLILVSALLTIIIPLFALDIINCVAGYWGVNGFNTVSDIFFK